MSEETGGPETMINGEDNMPQVALIAQYVKDLSFENPSAPGIYQAPEQPQIDVQFNIGSQLAGEDVYEVALKIEVTAKQGDLTAYVVELIYAGLFGIRNVPEEHLPPFLLAEAPRLLFPYARRVVADAIRDGLIALGITIDDSRRQLPLAGARTDRLRSALHAAGRTTGPARRRAGGRSLILLKSSLPKLGRGTMHGMVEG